MTCVGVGWRGGGRRGIEGPRGGSRKGREGRRTGGRRERAGREGGGREGEKVENKDRPMEAGSLFPRSFCRRGDPSSSNPASS